MGDSTRAWAETVAQTGTLDGEAPADPEAGTRTALPIGTLSAVQIDRYVLEHPVGAGGMGVVYAAHDPELDRPVAIKLLQARHGVRDAESGERRLLREARAMAKLDHPNVIRVYDVGTYELPDISAHLDPSIKTNPDARGVYIVMELVDGMDLMRWRSHRTRTWSQILDVFVLAARGLAAAHAAGFVHRDFKPGNVIITSDRNVKVLDFGLARAFGGGSSSSSGDVAIDPRAPATDTTVTEAGIAPGTPRYMAPEQYTGERIDARADQFAWCVSLYEALYGQPPFGSGPADAQRRARITGTHLPPPAGTNVPAWLYAILDRGLSRDPDARWPSIDAILAVIDKRRRVRRRGIGVLAIGAAMGVAAGIGALVGSERAGQRAEREHNTAVVTDAPPPTSAPDPVPKRDAIALLPFEDRTAQGRVAAARDTLPHVLTKELRRIETLEVVDYFALSRIAEPSRGDRSPPERWRAAAAELGAGIYVHGAIEDAGPHLRLLVEIHDANARRIGSLARDVEVEGLGDAVRGLAPDVASAVLGRAVDLRLDPGRPWAYESKLAEGLGLLERGLFQEAEAALRAAGEAQPDAAEIHFHLALALSWAERPDDALTEIERALERDATQAQRAFLTAYGPLIQGRDAQAIEDFRVAAVAHPGDRYIEYGLFEALFHGGYPADAMAVYRKAAARLPVVHTAFMHLLNYYASQGDREGLVWALELARTVEAQAAAQGTTLLAVFDRDYDAAFTELARTAGPNNYLGERALVEVHAIAGNAEIARTLAEQYAADDPTTAAVMLAALHTLRGDASVRALYRDRARQAALSMRYPRAQFFIIADLALLALPDADPTELEPLRRDLVGIAEKLGQVEQRMDVIQALIAAALADEPALTTARASEFPEVAAIARAWFAEHKGDFAAAQDAWREAIRASLDGRFVLVERWHLARVSALAGDPATQSRECDELRRPRLFHWSWAAVAQRPPCDQP